MEKEVLKYGQNWGLAESMGRAPKVEKSKNVNSMEVLGWELRLAGAQTINFLSLPSFCFSK